MAELAPQDDAPVRLTGVGAVLDKLSQAFAMAGGLVFVALIAMSIVSIVGRKLANAPVQGDIELMQMGAAVGAATFLPICELFDHHIKVDALTGWMSQLGRDLLDTLAHGLLFVAAALMTWRTALSAIDTQSSGEMSTLLLIPQWIPVALLVPSLALFACCAAYRIGLCVRKLGSSEAAP
jgi:TRAP-type C4-dicarboxylate transport system permease small subunit